MTLPLAEEGQVSLRKLHEALQERVAMQGKTAPELARGILSKAMVERPLDTPNPDWSPGFFEQLRAVDSETVAAVDDLLASVRQARTSKAPRSL